MLTYIGSIPVLCGGSECLSLQALIAGASSTLEDMNCWQQWEVVCSSLSGVLHWKYELKGGMPLQEALETMNYFSNSTDQQKLSLNHYCTLLT